MPPRDVLGVPPGASPPEIAAAFRRYALRHHPDRGGDPTRFQAGVDEYHRLTGSEAGTATAAPPANVVFYRRSRVRPSSLLHLARRRFSSSLRP